jgi:hypothetical protein
MLKYSKERPQIPGFYFVKARGDLSGKIYQTVVHVYKSQATLEHPDRVSWDGDNYWISDDCFIEFAGPIAEPVDEV